MRDTFKKIYKALFLNFCIVFACVFLLSACASSDLKEKLRLANEKIEKYEEIIAELTKTETDEEKEEEVKTPITYEGKKIIGLGDSIYEYSARSMFFEIKDKLNFDSYHAHGEGGSTITKDIHSNGYGWYNSMVNWIDVHDGLNSNSPFWGADVVIFEQGTNDFNAKRRVSDSDWDAFIGSNDPNDMTKSTLRGAMRYAIKYFKTNYSNARLIWCTPLYRGDIDTQKEKQRFAKIRNVIMDICDEQGIECMDMYNLSGINAINRDFYFTNGDLLHPAHNGVLAMQYALIDYLSEGTIDARLKYETDKIDTYKGGKIVGIGDSIYDSDFAPNPALKNNLQLVYKNIASELGMASSEVVGNSGATIVEIPGDNNTLIQRIKNGDYEKSRFDGASIVVIELGTNDFGNVGIHKDDGEWTKFLGSGLGETDTKKLYGAISYAITYFKDRFGADTKFIWTTPPYRDNENYKLDDMRRILMECGEHFGFYVLDLKESLGFNSDNSAKYLHDGLHFSVNGYEKLQYCLVDYIRSI